MADENTETENATFIPAPPGMTVLVEAEDGEHEQRLATVIAIRISGDELIPYSLIHKDGQIVSAEDVVIMSVR